MHKTSHFTVIVFWQGLRYFYDGLQSSDLTCFRPVKVEDFKEQVRSYAIHMAIPFILLSISSYMYV